MILRPGGDIYVDNYADVADVKIPVAGKKKADAGGARCYRFRENLDCGAALKETRARLRM